MKKRALEEAKNYNRYVLESYGETNMFGQLINQDFTRKDITFKDVEKLVKTTTQVVETYMFENDRYIKIGEHQTIICKHEK